jgi:hypothetical protein
MIGTICSCPGALAMMAWHSQVDSNRGNARAEELQQQDAVVRILGRRAVND